MSNGLDQTPMPPSSPFPEFKWRWASTTPSESINDPKVILGVLEVMYRHNNKRHATQSFRNDLIDLEKTLSSSVNLSRKDRGIERNIIENSGQYWKILGLINSTRDGTISLTQLGIDLVTGAIDEDGFIKLVVDDFELPNKYIENDNLIEKWKKHQIQIKPIKLIFQILIELSKKTASPTEWYLTAAELRKIVVPLSAYPQVTAEGFVEKLIEFRSHPENMNSWPDCTPGDNDRRMLNEYLIFLEGFGYLDTLIVKDGSVKRYYINQKSALMFGNNLSKNAVDTKTQLTNPTPENDLNYLAFYEAAIEANYFVTKDLTLRFISALITKPFVILTGLSGSGKTKLAILFAKWICSNEDQICVVPIGADWTNREPLLGYPNALKSGEYIKPESGVLDLILRAIHSSETGENQPYFLILDEMNLSHVERYFSDFLSSMESNEHIYLHSSTSINDEIPNKFKLPKNLFIIGTVNIDETTYMFSPKVLDRASVIEFQVTEAEISNYLENQKSIDLSKIERVGSFMASDFLNLSTSNEITENPNNLIIKKTLINFFATLKNVGSEFGYRTSFEILRFCNISQILEPKININEVIDSAVLQKLLPKIHGSRRKLEPTIKVMAMLCIENIDDFKIESYLSNNEKLPMGCNVILPRSLDKISRMYKSLLENGFTSFSDA
jgi:5-methylcytosine-specific restriction protein B